MCPCRSLLHPSIGLYCCQNKHSGPPLEATEAQCMTAEKGMPADKGELLGWAEHRRGRAEWGRVGGMSGAHKNTVLGMFTQEVNFICCNGIFFQVSLYRIGLQLTFLTGQSYLNPHAATQQCWHSLYCILWGIFGCRSPCGKRTFASRESPAATIDQLGPVPLI